MSFGLFPVSSSEVNHCLAQDLFHRQKNRMFHLFAFFANFSLLLFYWFSKNKSTIQALISAQISVGAENSETQELPSEDRLIIVKFF